MLYSEYINKAIKLTIDEADNGLSYLEPLWKVILFDNDMNITVISDMDIEWNDVYNVLKLETEKRNTINSNKPFVIDWLYDLITAKVEPAMMQEETEYIKQVIEFMKANHESQKLNDNEELEKFKES